MIAKGGELTFIDTGHILGSAQVILDIEDGEDGQKKRLLFSGDVGRGDNDLLRDPVASEDVDFVLIESSYGSREHGLGARSDDKVAEVLSKALKKGGKVIIPAFAVERTQQQLYVLHELFRSGAIPDIPVYVDSPLAVNATEIS